MASHDGDDGTPSDGTPPDPGAPLPPDLNPRGRRAGSARRPGGMRRGAVIGLAVIVTLASVGIVGASGWAWWTYKDFKAGIRRVNAITPVGKPKQDVDGKDQNLLIAGNDDRDTATDKELKQLGTERDGGSYNTDTMMVMHVPANGAKATVISFPRDTYVAIPGHGMGKLNSAYPDGIVDGHGSKATGARLLVRTIEGLTGLTIDHFVQVDLLGFYRISNAIGGVPVNLCEPQKEANSGINLPKGVSVIKGTQALAFVRQRYDLPNGDFDRIRRQQYFLSAAFRKVSSAGVLLNPFKLQKLLKAVNTSLQMDNSLDPLKLAEQMQNLTAGNLVFKTIPNKGGTTNEAGAVIVVDPAQVKQFAKQVVAGTNSSQFGNAKTVAPGSFALDILNGSNTDGAASRNAAALRQKGFKVDRISTAPATATTVIKYPKGMESQAKTLAAQISGVAAEQTRSVTRVTLVLGSDGLQVSAAHSTKSTAPAPTSSNGMTAAQTNTCIN